jgi:HlyD family secretion protein
VTSNRGRSEDRRLRTSSARALTLVALMAPLCGLAAGCAEEAPTNELRASGYVEATEVTVAAEVGGRLEEVAVKEGDRVEAGAVIARLDTKDAELQMARVRAERDVAEAQLRLVQAAPRAEDVRYAQAQVDAAEADATALDVDIKSAELDLTRFESLLAANAGSQKQRDDARARLDGLRERQRGARERVRVAREAVARVVARARPEEVAAARTRVGAVAAQLPVLEKSVADAVVKAPAAGIVTQDLVDAGEVVAPRMPLVVLTDLDRAWANAFVPEPAVPRIKLGQAATVHTDAGQMLPGTVTFVSSRAEFTPRNVQTADERSRLVYRIKVSVDNSAGILKQGMPVDVTMVLP